MEQKQYWTLTCLGLTENQVYQKKALPLAKTWLSQQSYVESQSLETELLTVFNASQEEILNQAKVGLCLRCYVSHHILTACKKLKAKNTHLNFRELLAKILDDEGKALIIFDHDNNPKFIDQAGNQILVTYLPSSIEIIKTYGIQKGESQQKSLKNWVYLKVPQNQEVKSFLLENNIQLRSHWGILNKATSSKIAKLASDEQQIMTAYEQVYKRDRRNSNQQRSKCLDPSIEQLQEMINLLKQDKLMFEKPEDLFKKLKEIAQKLREIDISKNTLSLDGLRENNTSFDISDESLSVDTLESTSFIQTIREQFEQILSKNIETVVKEKMRKLKKKDKDQIFINGLLLYYQDSRSLSEISKIVGITIDQAKRLFKPAELIKLVRSKTASSLLEFLIKLRKQQDLISNNPDNLSYLTQQVEGYLDQQVFNAAAMEIKAGKNRSFDSLYAKKLIAYLNSLS